MSRIGKMPIAVPAGVTVDIAENNNRICPHGRFRNQPSRNAAAIQEGRL